MVEKNRKSHAIMVSVPFQGHINPFVSLALKLASKGITVTFIHIEHVHQKLSKAHNSNGVDFFSEAQQSGLDIRYTTIDDGFPLEFDRDVVHFEDYWETMLRDFEGRVGELVGKIIGTDPDAAHFLVTDTIWNWPLPIAHKFKLVNVSFWTQPALVFSLHYHWDLLTQNGHFPLTDDANEEINYVPGVESISTRDLSTVFYESILSSMMYTYMSLSFERVKKADFILHNTVHELESETLSALKKYQPNYAIGPVNFSKNLPTDHSTINMSLWSESDCANWLESKSPASVLYVSFGSFVQTDKQIIEEIAHGLLLSGVNFMWVIRQGLLKDGDTDVFPDGFLDEIKDNGLIVPWCNQTMVLSSPAVGGFLTHTGWNSTVESMWCGVPMICYPVAFDQLTNRKLVVDDWKIGINLCDGKSIDRKEVAEKIKSVVINGAYSKSLKQEVSKLRAILHNALETDDGSSERNFHQFIQDLEAKIHHNLTT
ncbi:hypothetical protein ACS0TY_015354 [Phlomoides rotata]